MEIREHVAPALRHLAAVAGLAARTAQDVLATAYVAAVTIAVVVLVVPMLAFAAVASALKLFVVVRRFTMLWLLASSGAAAFLIASGRFHDPWSIAVLAVLLYLIGASYKNATRMPATPDSYLPTIHRRWPDRWFASVLKVPINAIFIRHVVANSIVMGCALVALAAPQAVSLVSVSFYVLALALVMPHHERMDHTDIHNRNFRSKHPAGPAAVLVRCTELYMRWILNPMCGRVPHFYRAQHVLIHHVENNGPEDVQTTVHGDRSSFLHLARCALRFGLSWSFGIDVWRYLHRKRRSECIPLVAGFAFWFGAIALLAVHNAMAASTILAVRFMLGLPVAVYTFYWHGLVDVENVDDVFGSSIDLVSRDLSGPANLHIRHHRYAGEHWAKQNSSRDIGHLKSRRRAEPLLIRIDTSPLFFVGALLRRRFDLIAGVVVPSPGSTWSPAETEALIRRRTLPLASGSAGGVRRGLDSFLANCYGAFLLGIAGRRRAT